MKLLLYSHFFAPSIGGVETIVVSLARGLSDLRDSNGAPEFQVAIVTQTPAQKHDDGGLPFRVVRQPSALQLFRLIRECDLVHAAGPALAPLLLALLARKPIVVEHHGFQAICPNGQLFMEPQSAPCPGHFMAQRHDECVRCNSSQGWLVSWKLWLLTFVRRFLCSQAYANIAPTQWLGGLLNLPRITVIPHGLDAKGVGVYEKAAHSGAPVITFMGRLVTTKGVRVLLKAAKILEEHGRNFELLIIGGGPERSALEKLACDSQLAAYVRFAGRMEDDELDAALTHTSAVVVPSLGGEVFGLVVAESMARGLPVIASDLGAFVEVLGGTGLTFRTGDPADLASALARLLDDPVATSHLAQRACQRVLDSFNSRRMVASHARLYRLAGESHWLRKNTR